MGRVSLDGLWWMDDYGNIVPYQGQDLAGVTGMTTYTQPMGADTTSQAYIDRSIALNNTQPPNISTIPIQPSGNYALPGTGNLAPSPFDPLTQMLTQPTTPIAPTPTPTPTPIPTPTAPSPIAPQPTAPLQPQINTSAPSGPAQTLTPSAAPTGGTYNFLVMDPNGQLMNIGSTLPWDVISQWGGYQGYQLIQDVSGQPPNAQPNINVSSSLNTAQQYAPVATNPNDPSYVSIPNVPQDTGPGSEGGFRIRLLGPNGEWKFSRDISEIDSLLNQGYKPVGDDGNFLNVTSFNGGTLIDGLPINTALYGTMTDAQRTALINGGKWNSMWDNIPIVTSTSDPGVGSTGNTGGPPAPPSGGPTHPADTGYFGNQGATAPGLPDDFKKMLMDLMQRSLNQGAAGQQAFAGIMDDLKNYLAFSRAGAEQSYNTRNQLATDMLGRLNPAIESALANMNTSQGLSPEAMSALRGNAIEGSEAGYQGQASQLKSMLGQRGAYGGETPGSLGDIVRGYGPLMAARDANRTGLLRDALLADEQRKFESLGLNRQTGLGALAAGNQALGTIGNIYNPSPFLQANESALSGLLSGTNAYNNAGFQGLQTAGGLAGILGDQQVGSFSNLLKSALAGTAGSVLSQLPWGRIFNSIGGIFTGGNSGGGNSGGTLDTDWTNFRNFWPQE